MPFRINLLTSHACFTPLCCSHVPTMPTNSSPSTVLGPIARTPRLLFVLAGQSNMAGRDAVLPSIPAQASASSSSIRCFAQRKDEWEAAAHPLHQDKPEKAGVGPGLTIAIEVQRLYDQSVLGGIGLVPCSQGGTELARWEEGGDLFIECVRRVKLALEDHDRPVHLGGLFWHQGENDCGNASSAATYAARLPRALDALRCALGEPELPVVVGELGYWLDQADPDYAHAPAINAAIVEAPQAMTNCACVSAHGLAHKGDRLHFCAESAEELGRRYASAWLELQSHTSAAGGDRVKRQRRITTSDGAFSFPQSLEEGQCSDGPATEVGVRD
jgi:hypothetical protein